MVNTILEGLQGWRRENSILLSKANGRDFYEKDERALPGVFQSCKISFSYVCIANRLRVGRLGFESP
jgi:hypothetical protein